MLKKQEIEVFERTIDEHNLLQYWGEVLFLSSEETIEEIVSRRYIAARQKFKRIMSSEKNDGSQRYLRWAINVSLGVKPTKASYRQSLNKRMII